MWIKRKFLLTVLQAARVLGFFYIARRLTGRSLRILCYHGSALDTENRFYPALFMSRDVFSERLEFLAHAKYPILALPEAVKRLKDGSLPNCATVITIDDGWYGSYQHQLPLLRKHRFPATLYLTTYYAVKQTQVFNVALRYAYLASEAHPIDAEAVSELAQLPRSLPSNYDEDTFLEILCEAADSLNSAHQRQELLRALLDLLGIDWRHLEQKRMFTIASLEEIAEMSQQGIDVQLHTHRHRFREGNFDEAAREIEENRHYIQTATNRQPVHFCFPSGHHTEESVSYLPQLGIETATTTDPGFNWRDAPPLLLKRFIDSEKVSQVEFEAEMSGFFELMRKVGIRI